MIRWSYQIPGIATERDGKTHTEFEIYMKNNKRKKKKEKSSVHLHGGDAESAHGAIIEVELHLHVAQLQCGVQLARLLQHGVGALVSLQQGADRGVVGERLPGY